MERFSKITTWVLVLVFVMAVFLYDCQRRIIKAELETVPPISASEALYINATLDSKGAGDCELSERKWYGWSCRERDGKTFTVFVW